MAARVTVVRPGGLGDTILVLPALRALGLLHPGARLTLVGSSWAEALRPLVPFPVEVVRIDDPALLPLFGPSPADDASGVFSGAEAVVLYTDSPDETLAVNARRFRPDTVLWPLTPPPGVHACDHFGAAVGEDWPDAPELRIPEDLLRRGREWIAGRLGPGARPAAIHPGSGGRRERWPAGRFAEAAGLLDRPVVMMEGPADEEACRAFLAEAPPGLPVARAAGLSVAEAAAVVAGCGAFLGCDSGMSHLAAALGAATVAVFGPTDPAVWAPRGRRVRVVPPGKGGPWAGAGDVAAALRAVDSS